MTMCPCGSLKDYAMCCGIYIDEQKIPETPEQLMRSRYTAYTQANIPYITLTMKPPASLQFQAEAAEEWAKRVHWHRLEVLATAIQGKVGFVEFIAHFDDDAQQQVLHEISEFHLENNRWYYVDGKSPKNKPFVNQKKVNRNDKCSCGSGKKYKKCCGHGV